MRDKTGLIICSLLLFFIIFVGCSAKLNKPVNQDNLIIYPSPPDTTRIQYLTSISTSDDVAKKRSSFTKFVVGENESQRIVKPYGLAIKNGKLYVCDTILGGLEIIDLVSGEFKYFTPSGLGELKKPINCHVDEDGNLYVADAKRRQIVVFDENGKYINSFGNAADIKPTDVFAYQDKLWVIDLNNHMVKVYSKDNYELLNSFPNASVDSPEYLRSPTNLHVIDDKVYVSDIGDFKIKIFTTDGEFISAIGSYGRNMGQFVRPKGIAVDNNLNLFVVDAGFDNVQIFGADGSLLMFFGGSYKKPGDMWLPAKVIVDYDNLEYFEKYVHQSFKLKYLIFVTNQYGPDKINVYGYVGPEMGPRPSKERITRKRG